MVYMGTVLVPFFIFNRSIQYSRLFLNVIVTEVEIKCEADWGSLLDI